MSMFGFGGNFDDALNDKVNKLLAGLPSNEDKIHDFVQKDVGIDPESLPLTIKAAEGRLLQWASAVSGEGCLRVHLLGNSLGLSRVEWAEADASAPCPACGAWSTPPPGLWTELRYCEPCAKFFSTFDAGVTTTVVTHGDAEWHTLERIWEALTVVHGPDFVATTQYNATVECVTIEAPPMNPDPMSYAPGTVLRVIGGESDFQYVRVGGLFGDNVLTNLHTMAPIQEQDAWRVVEVLT